MKKRLTILVLFLMCVIAPLFSACNVSTIKDVSGISLNYSSYSLVAGDDIDIIATVTPNDAGNKNVNFFISDTYPYTDLTSIEENNSYVQFTVHERYSNIVNIKIKSSCNYEGSFYLNAITEEGNFEAHCVFNFYPPMRNLGIPQNVIYNPTTKRVEWETVENAKSYLINVNGEEIATPFNYFSNFNLNLLNTVKVKAVGEEYKFSNSPYSSAITFCVLGNVKNLSHSGGRIEWDDLQYAKGYIVDVNGNPTVVGKINYFNLTNAVLSPNVYTIKVYAIGNDENNIYSSGTFSSLEIRRLSAPQNFTYQNGMLSWEMLPEERDGEFTISFYDAENLTLILSETVRGLEYNFNNNLPAGIYNINIYAVGDNISTLTSATANVNNLRRLLKPTNLRVENGKLAWDDNEFATGYSIKINDKIIEYDRPNDIVFETSYILGSAYAPQQYTISICAKGNGSTTISSAYTPDLVATKLNKPTNIQFNNGTVFWDSVMVNVLKTVDSYKLIFENDYENQTALTNEFIFGTDTPAGNYAFKIQATSNGCFSSEYSDVKKISKLETVKNLRVQNGKIHYDAVSDAKEYKIKINDNDYITNNSNLLFTLAGLNYNPGTYQINVIACGNANSQIQSNELATPLEVIKLGMPTGFGVVDGEINFVGINSVPNATGFIFNVSGKEVYNIDDINIVGTSSLKVKAKGDIGGENAKYLDSDYTTEFFATKLEAVNSLQISEGIFSFAPVTGASNYDIIIKNLNDDEDIQIINTVSEYTYSIYNSNPGVYNITVLPYGTTGNTGELFLNNKTVLNSYTFRKLDEVKNFSIADKENINLIQQQVLPGSLIWDKVTGALGYQLIIDGQEIEFQTSNLNFSMDKGNFMAYLGDVSIEEGMHSYQIYAKGNGSTVIEGAKNTPINATKIGTASNIRLEDDYIIWDNPENSTEAIVVIDHYFYYVNNKYKIEQILGEGTYSATIICVPNNTDFTIGNFSQPFFFTKLGAPKNIRIEDGYLKWMTNLAGDGYKIAINDGTSTEVLDVLNLSGKLDNSINSYDFATNYRGLPGTYTISMCTIGTKTVTSNFSTSITATVLAYPSNLKTTNGKIVFNPVPNARYYELIINNNFNEEKIIKLTTTEFVLDEDYLPGSYSVRVRAVGDESKYLTSLNSPEYNIIKLNAPTNLKVVDGKIKFVGVENATSYTLKILPENGVAKTVNIGLTTEYSLDSNYAAMGYSIYVMANGSVNIGIYQNSDYSDIIENELVYKLPYPSNIKMLNGLLMWDAVENATKYYININNTVFDLGLQTSFDMPVQLQDIYGNTQLLGAGDYNIKLCAIGDGTDLDAGIYLNSDYDPNSIIFKKLPTISNFKVKDGVLTWDEIPAAVNGLELVIISVNEEIKKIKLFNTTEYSFDASFLIDVQYSTYVITLGDSTNMFNSDRSAILTQLEKLECPMNLSVGSDNKLLFDLDDNAMRYKIILDGEKLIFDADHQFVFGESVSEGVHTVKIQALGANTTEYPSYLDNKFLNSEYSTEITVTKPATPQNISIYKGKVTWDACEYASGYKVELYYTADPENAYILLRTVDVGNKTYLYLSENGYYSIKVQAYFTDSLSSNMSDEVAGEFRMFDGLGTIENPFQIKDAQNLRDMRYNPTAYYLLTTNIDIANDANAGLDGIYIPAGTVEDPFVGQLDGANFTISNLTFTMAGNIYSALFGVVANEGVVKNINFENVNITNGYYIGAVAGKNYGTITNCNVVSGSMLLAFGNDTSPIYLGAIVGYNDIITLADGETKIPAVIQYCNSNIQLSHPSTALIVYTGGISGYNKGRIYRCGNDYIGTISGNIVGGLTGANQGLVQESYNLSNISALAVSSEGVEASGYAGGLVGYNSYSPFSSESNSIVNCYNQGNVSAFSQYSGKVPHAGGLVGYNKSKIRKCYTTGDYSATSNQPITTYGAAVIGYNEGLVDYCFYKKDNASVVEVNGVRLANSCVGYSTAQMSNASFVDELNNGYSVPVFIINNGNFPKLSYEN